MKKYDIKIDLGVVQTTLPLLMFAKAIRAFNFNNEIRAFLKQNSNVVVINIGAGLDTTFQRID